MVAKTSEHSILNFYVPVSYTGNSSSNPSPPPDIPSVDAAGMEPYRSDIHVDADVPVRGAISKRKVASAPAAPAYKGNCGDLGSLW